MQWNFKDGDVKICNSKGEDGEALAFDNPKAIAIINDPPPVCVLLLFV